MLEQICSLISLSLLITFQLRKRYRMTCDFPPKKIRNSSAKVLETRRVALEQYLQQVIKQCQRSSKPLPQPLLDFLEVSINVPKVTNERLSNPIGRETELNSVKSTSATHKPVVGFVCKEPFLYESSNSLNVSLTGLPDIVAQSTLQYFYT